MDEIEVRVRHENDRDAVHLCTWPATELDNLIPAVSRWGITDITGDGFIEPELTGTFVYSPEGAFFEVLIHAEPEGTAP